MARSYKQGFYTPKNPEKYDGNPNGIVYRSSWEYKFMHWLDANKQVISWNSECIVIPYISPVDSRTHRYFVDFKMKLINNAGETKTYLVEIKPEIQTMPPKVGKKTKRYINEVMTYSVNSAIFLEEEEVVRSIAFSVADSLDAAEDVLFEEAI